MIKEGEVMNAMRKRIEKHCYIGLAIMSVGTDDDDGKGPTILRGDAQYNKRKVLDGELAAMHKQLREGRDLQPFQWEHAISIIVNPKAIDLSSLTFSSKESDHKQVIWNAGYAGVPDLAWLLDGNHRVEYIRAYLLKGTYEALVAAKKALLQLHINLVKDKSKEQPLIKIINQCKETIAEKGSWLVRFYSSSKPNLCLNASSLGNLILPQNLQQTLMMTRTPRP